MTPSRSELILGGQKSGKSRRAELLARDWLAANPAHRASLIATATYQPTQPTDQRDDDGMHQRILRHQRDRAERVPGLLTLEEPLQLADVIAQYSQPHTLLVVDCLTLWLTNWLMPAPYLVPRLQTLLPGWEEKTAAEHMEQSGVAIKLIASIQTAPGPVVLVGNEIGLGVIPLGREVRAFVDALGSLNQQVAAACERVTLMAAGLPLTLKGSAA
ncbi:bifunctional adenosylcobinamide kinase/adenosylcobinamide-phosphate guanylyltransferase [Curvibacter sp. CHRR-16]|uniref:bifunctional adenosylcobinamide kinase/adenosylcobinamide-phosphate guanylyltransferase n=1 Tax=Curvibacter sp. CHRR-16 TaxID=2835872 RepID=UPI001BD9DE98|nr:bifunctional adenosylcobinamide kinase/adenosylcobinamide-phosphate guanylyltransferase [Curvibacter sp. CHRR-16]MBT0569215.1 bifunctional adenosylcobinamide kinase/adenosylcobinamide-phosphate guanylyltransferase [Curvibacter sp. CHRR-16]